jgi:hypothetical protein
VLDAKSSLPLSDRNHIQAIQTIFVDDLVKPGGHTAVECRDVVYCHVQ